MVDYTTGLRGKVVTWWLADHAAFADRTSPKLGELNTSNERLVLNITCALDKGTSTMTVGSSSLDENMSFCDDAGFSRPNGVNPEASLALFRDADRAANGVFNKALAWFLFPDRNFYIIRRVGDLDAQPDVAVRATDYLQMIDVRTDYPADTLANGAPAYIVQNFLQNGFIRWNQTPGV